MEIIVINHKGMGRGDDLLGLTLMGAFLKKLWAKEKKPSMMVFYNSGVLLLEKSMGLLDVLHGLESSGVELLACGTCLNHYGLTEQLEVGRVSNMEEIVNLMDQAQKVVTI